MSGIPITADEASARLVCADRLRSSSHQIIATIVPRLRSLAESYRVLPDDVVHESLGAFIEALAESITQDDLTPLRRFLDSVDQYWILSGMNAAQALRGLHLFVDVCHQTLQSACDAHSLALIERWVDETAILAAERAVAMVASQLETEVERHRQGEERLLGLQRVSAAVVSELDLDRTLDVIVQEAMRLVQGSAAAIRLVDDEKRSLRLIASSGSSDGLLHVENLPIEGTLTGYCFLSEKPVVSNDLQRDHRVSEDIRWMSRLRSLLIVPLLVRDRPIGVLLVTDRERGLFTPEDQRLLGLFADQASTAIEHAGLYQQAQSRIAELAALQRISSIISSSLDIDEVFRAIYDEIREVVVADAFIIGLIRPDGLFDLEFIMDGGQRYAPLREFEISPTIMETVRTRRPVVVADTESDAIPRMHTVGHPQTQVRSVIAVPLLRGAQVVGLLSAQSYTPQMYSDSDAQLLLTIANQAVVAIEHARLYGQAQTLAVAEERNRLAREIHDTLAQGLIGIILYLERLDLMIPETEQASRRMIDRTINMARSNLEEARRSVRDLRAAPLEGRTLPEAINHLVAEVESEHPFEIALSVSANFPMLAARVETALFRMVQEAVSNCRKHAQCTNLTITLSLVEEMLRIEVCDDGLGFEPAVAMVHPARFGLSSMRERITQIGGTFEVESEPNHGTSIRALIPLRRAIYTEPEPD